MSLDIGDPFISNGSSVKAILSVSKLIAFSKYLSAVIFGIFAITICLANLDVGFKEPSGRMGALQ